jgi:hypothetical protein
MEEVAIGLWVSAGGGPGVGEATGEETFGLAIILVATYMKNSIRLYTKPTSCSYM